MKKFFEEPKLELLKIQDVVTVDSDNNQLPGASDKFGDYEIN